MKIEIGGGDRNRGEGWINVDQLDCADVRHDLDVIPWPFDDGAADELYSAHCIEHVKDFRAFLRECARICKVGAKVEIRCPDACGEMAMCAGHESVVSINVMRHADHVFPERFWLGTERRLKLQSVEPGCDDYWFHEARKNPLFRAWSDHDILTWLPRTRHENRFHFIAIETEDHLRAK